MYYKTTYSHEKNDRICEVKYIKNFSDIEKLCPACSVVKSVETVKEKPDCVLAYEAAMEDFYL